MFQFSSRPDFPKRVTVELSSQCNLSCTMCPRRYVPIKPGFMTVGLFKKIVAELKHRGVEAVVPFFRGESLLHPDFLEMMTHLRRYTSVKIQLATNALYLNEAIMTGLLSLEIDFISFSVDAYREETYNKIRQGGDYHQAVNNVREFLRLRAARKNGNNIMVQVSATENAHNRSEIKDFIAYWKKTADRVRIYPRHSRGGKFGKLERSKYKRNEGERLPCRKLFTDFVIYYNGDVALCNHDWNRGNGIKLGSVEQHSMSEIWNGGGYEKIFKKHQNRLWGAVRPCRDCDHWIGPDKTGLPIGGVFD